MKANAAMQPTSLASERLFNKDKLLYGTTRQSLTEEHGKGFIFLHEDDAGQVRVLRQVPGHSLPGGQPQADLPQAQQVKVTDLSHLITLPINMLLSSYISSL